MGSTAPNPMVGCVIVHNDSIIGEGYTSPYGGPHAEVNAIRSVQQPELLPESTLYVSLEPCCHYGKTPPCTNLILDSGIPRVVIGLQDPNPVVAGKGIEVLKSAGCEVIFGILEADCKHHHRRFLTFQTKQRPYIILKWAQSPDGFLAPEHNVRDTKKEPYWISSRRSRQLVHRWRTEEAAILIGTETAIEDNPQLNSRLWAGKNPIRIVLDRRVRIPHDRQILDGSVRTLLICDPEAVPKNTGKIEYIPMDFGMDFLNRLCAKLYELGILSLIVEGGSKTLNSFLDVDLWDEARVFEGGIPLKRGVLAPRARGILRLETQITQDRLQIWYHD